ncbi:MAG: hypothetical protein ACLFWD_06005 [Anaerolineales bacterium]
MNWILNPPISLALYLGLAGLIYWIGRLLAGPADPSVAKSSTYASGEAPPTSVAAPGYRPFFIIALFFAVLHLGVLVLGTATGTIWPIVYLIGLIMTLLAFILG